MKKTHPCRNSPDGSIDGPSIGLVLGTATGYDDGAYEGSSILNLLGTADGVKLRDALGAALGLNEGLLLGMLEGVGDLNEGNSDGVAVINDGATEGRSRTNKTDKKMF